MQPGTIRTETALCQVASFLKRKKDYAYKTFYLSSIHSFHIWYYSAHGFVL